MSNTKKHAFNELEAMQLGQAVKAALREKSPLKLTISRCAKAMEKALKQYSDKKNLVLEEIVVKDEDGNMMPIEGLEREPMNVTEYQLSIPEKDAIERFQSISDEEVEVELPVINGSAVVLMNGEKVSLDDYLDMNPDASGSMAYIYLTLCD